MTTKEKKKLMIQEINKLLEICNDEEIIDLIYVILVNNLPMGDD